MRIISVLIVDGTEMARQNADIWEELYPDPEDVGNGRPGIPPADIFDQLYPEAKPRAPLKSNIRENGLHEPPGAGVPEAKKKPKGVKFCIPTDVAAAAKDLPTQNKKALTIVSAPPTNAARDYPADPAPYDAAAEDQDYSRSLLSGKEKKKIDKGVKKTGFLTIEDVRGLVRDNSPKESMEARGEVYALEPELLILIDTRTNYKIFIAGDNVYTREELFDHYPFERFKVLPEEIFSQQEIGVFPAKKHAMNPDEFEYVARDAGDKTVEFVMVEDMVGQATRPKYQAQRAPVRVVKTKIYIGREAWDNFSLLYRFGKAVGKIVHAQIEGGREAFNPLMLLAPAQAAPGPKLLTNGDLEKEMAERVRAAEEHAKQAAAEVQKIREAAEAEKKRLEEQFRKDIERIEAMIDRKRSRRDTKQREAPNAKKIGKTEVKSANASFETKEDLTQADSVAI